MLEEVVKTIEYQKQLKAEKALLKKDVKDCDDELKNADQNILLLEKKNNVSEEQIRTLKQQLKFNQKVKKSQGWIWVTTGAFAGLVTGILISN